MKVRFQGRKDVLLRVLRKCAMKGLSLQRDASRIQAEFDKARRKQPGEGTVA